MCNSRKNSSEKLFRVLYVQNIIKKNKQRTHFFNHPSPKLKNLTKTICQKIVSLKVKIKHGCQHWKNVYILK